MLSLESIVKGAALDCFGELGYAIQHVPFSTNRRYA